MLACGFGHAEIVNMLLAVSGIVVNLQDMVRFI